RGIMGYLYAAWAAGGENHEKNGSLYLFVCLPGLRSGVYSSLRIGPQHCGQGLGTGTTDQISAKKRKALPPQAGQKERFRTESSESARGPREKVRHRSSC